MYITNVVKCRPPGNRDPEPSEIAACAPYLKRQLEVLDPAVIVTLGRHSLGHFNPGARIGATHGTVRPVGPESGAPDAVTFAMYHPAAALRQGSLKQTMLADMADLPQVLIDARDARRAKSATTSPEPPALAESLAAPEMTVADEPTLADEPAVDADRPAGSRQPELVPSVALVDAEIEVDAEAVEAVVLHIGADETILVPVIDENQMQLFGA